MNLTSFLSIICYIIEILPWVFPLACTKEIELCKFVLGKKVEKWIGHKLILPGHVMGCALVSVYFLTFQNV